jgi:hypothetical protein
MARTRRRTRRIIARGDEESSFGNAPRQWPERPTRCSATAIERGELIWQTRSTVPTSMPSSSDAVATRTLTWPSFSLRLGFEAQLAREASVVSGNVFFAHALGELMRNAFGEAARVHEHQGRTVRVDELTMPLVNFVPHFVGGDGAQLGGWELRPLDRACACGRR